MLQEKNSKNERGNKKMKKFYINDKKFLNEEELKSGCVSYGRIVKTYINDLILCNNIAEIDESIWNNFINAYEEVDMDIYQYCLCELNNYIKDKLADYGFILTHSDLLGLDVLCVTHCGTSWDYVMTDVEWTTNIDEV